MSEIDGLIGHWYRAPSGEIFEVVAVDGDERTIEIQYFDGGLEELDLESWNRSGMLKVEPPEDWTGAFDELERDDRGFGDIIERPENWNGPLSAFDVED